MRLSFFWGVRASLGVEDSLLNIGDIILPLFGESPNSTVSVVLQISSLSVGNTIHSSCGQGAILRKNCKKGGGACVVGIFGAFQQSDPAFRKLICG